MVLGVVSFHSVTPYALKISPSAKFRVVRIVQLSFVDCTFIISFLSFISCKLPRLNVLI